jgi:DNA polymerase epsilon subunit 1
MSSYGKGKYEKKGSGKKLNAKRGQGNYAQFGQAQRQEGGRGQSEWTKTINASADKIDKTMGFELFEDGPERTGWIENMCATSIEKDGRELSGLELYFLQLDGSTFKSIVLYEPYFYVAVMEGFEKDATLLLQRKFETEISSVSVVNLEDLDLANHLSGKLGRYLKLSFRNVGELQEVKRTIMPSVVKNQTNAQAKAAYSNFDQDKQRATDVLEMLVGMREYDVPYVVSVLCCAMPSLFQITDLACGTDARGHRLGDSGGRVVFSEAFGERHAS